MEIFDGAVQRSKAKHERKSAVDNVLECAEIIFLERLTFYDPKLEGSFESIILALFRAEGMARNLRKTFLRGIYL